VELCFTPCDASLALLLTAASEARRAVKGIPCSPLLCDVAAADDLAQTLSRLGHGEGSRIFTFFGMLPNFELGRIVRLASAARRGDILLVSANLAPGPDYAEGMRRILPGYDNMETRNWLMTLLLDLGIEPGDGEMRIHIEKARGLQRIAADFHFVRNRTLAVYGERVQFRRGEPLRLFFSWRHTPENCERLLKSHRLAVEDRWIAKSGEEGVFACRKI
jgi:uncharacterized SAM-dependent methyltransferase